MAWFYDKQGTVKYSNIPEPKKVTTGAITPGVGYRSPGSNIKRKKRETFAAYVKRCASPTKTEQIKPTKLRGIGGKFI